MTAVPKRKLWWLSTSVLLVLALVAGLALTVKHQPNFYRQSRLPAGEARRTSGIGREQLLRRARQAETASQIDRWLSSSELRPPV